MCKRALATCKTVDLQLQIHDFARCKRALATCKIVDLQALAIKGLLNQTRQDRNETANDTNQSKNASYPEHRPKFRGGGGSARSRTPTENGSEASRSVKDPAATKPPKSDAALKKDKERRTPPAEAYGHSSSSSFLEIAEDEEALEDEEFEELDDDVLGLLAEDEVLWSPRATREITTGTGGGTKKAAAMWC